MASPAHPIKIIVTGEHSDLDSKFPGELGFQGTPLEWIALPVLRFERLPIDSERINRVIEKPYDWIIFTSQRSVHFWTELMLEHGLDLPIYTRVACIGERTAEAAALDGYTPDFFPSSPGTENFLYEFEPILQGGSASPSILIPMAEGGRPTLQTTLKSHGVDVTVLALYRTHPRDDIDKLMTEEEIKKSSLILFTSPSSVDAFLRSFSIPEGVRIGSIGKFTGEHLQRKGYREFKTLPQGDFERVGELLC